MSQTRDEVVPSRASGDDIERHLRAALDECDCPDARFHIREVLQLVEIGRHEA